EGWHLNLTVSTYAHAPVTLGHSHDDLSEPPPDAVASPGRPDQGDTRHCRWRSDQDLQHRATLVPYFPGCVVSRGQYHRRTTISREERLAPRFSVSALEIDREV